MAGATVRAADDVGFVVQTFAGDDRSTVDYLTEQVLQAQPAEVQRFLLGTSVLDRMCASLCNAVMGRRDAQGMLDRLERAGIMMTALDDGRVWFRHHPLLRKLLRQHLRAEDDSAERRMLQVAAHWHFAQDNVGDALRCLAEADAMPEMIEAVLRHAPLALVRGRKREVVEWIDLIPLCTRREHSTLLLLEAAGRLSGREVFASRRIPFRFS